MDSIVDVAESWCFTPYQHQMSAKGAGCDCLGLVRGIWRELMGRELLSFYPDYSPDWAEMGQGEPLLDGLMAHFFVRNINAAKAGDILAFRLKPNAQIKHLAILMSANGVDDPNAIILHAYSGHAVVKSFLHPFWRKRIAGVFSFFPIFSD